MKNKQDHGFSTVSTLYPIRDHAILPIGWNLAVMNYLNMEHYPSLKDYWANRSFAKH